MGKITIQELENTFITSAYKGTAFRIQTTHTHGCFDKDGYMYLAAAQKLSTSE